MKALFISKPLMLKAKGEQLLLTLKFKKMQTQKMSLANIQGKLSRDEMKKIMAGSDGCLDEYSYDRGYPPFKGCCYPLRWEMNGTGTGTICMRAW
jgi:hypothetical protein